MKIHAHIVLGAPALTVYSAECETCGKITPRKRLEGDAIRLLQKHRCAK